MAKSNEIKCVNCKRHLEDSVYINSILKRFLKSIPKTTLIKYLVDLKILKEDYLTKEVTLKNG